MDDVVEINDRETVLPAAEISFGGYELKGWRVVSSFRDLVEHGPTQGQSLLIIGSGPRTDYWRARGATTLDIDPQFKPDITGDANRLIEVVGGQQYDAVIAEHVTIDPEGNAGVNFTTLVRQGAQVLVPSGELFIQSATTGAIPEDPTIKVATPRTAMETMREAGFQYASYYRGEHRALIEQARRVGDKVVVDSWYSEAEVIYYGRKAPSA
jgi:hypothetical protein